jgi:lysophospholipase L1-like esterase
VLDRAQQRVAITLTAFPVCALLFALVLSGCHDGPKVTKPATVVVVGDSLLYQSGVPLQRALKQRGWTAVLDGRPGSGIIGGFSIGSWPERIAALVRVAKPDIVVVELGTNGCTGCRSVAAGIDAVMAPLHDIERVYWVNVKENSPRPPHPKAVNAAIENAKHRFKNLRIIDMNKRFDDHPGLLMSDHIHFDTAGIAAFVELVADTLPNER